MNRPLHTPLHIKLIFALIAVAVLALPQPCRAFTLDTYAESSKLASGKWMKIRVPASGLYCIPVSTLRAWGFSDPAKVRVYGYGGRRIADRLRQSEYIDDLPAVAAELTSSGLVFYAAGPEKWSLSTSSRYKAELNVFSQYGYYFLTESDEPMAEIPTTGVAGANNPVSVAQGRIHHELEQALVSESGPVMGGEDFRTTRTRSLDFKTPGRTGDKVWIECQFIHKHIGASAALQIEADGADSQSFNIMSTSDSHYVYSSATTMRSNFTTSATDRFRLTLTYKPTRTVYLAHLDYISVNYDRALELDASGYTEFWSDSPQLSFSGDSDLRVWDVTNPAAIEKVNTTGGADSRHLWSTSRGQMRAYVAWRPGASLPAPAAVGRIDNQNLHADNGRVDMVIFAPHSLTTQARRLAELHEAEDSLRTLVVDPEAVYNEFSSGTPDISAFRKYLKMLYDRGNASGHPLRYALMMGRPTLDNRAILESTRRTGYINLPIWSVTNIRMSLNDNNGYCTDDFLAFLEDESGTDTSRDILSIAIGRIPSATVDDATATVDKIYQYVRKSKNGIWKNKMLVIADDGDLGKHLSQAEDMIDGMMASPGQQHTFKKVYIDAYDLIGGSCPDAHKEMFDALDEGVAWWIFTGHANDHSWTDENILTYNDINENVYFRNIPFMVAATCDFMRWDAAKISAGELLFNTRYGGVIAMISAARPVYIPNNGYFMTSLGKHAFDRDADGRLYSAGEMFRRVKNDVHTPSATVSPSDDNRLRYIFMGDPALRLASPSNVAELVSIDGKDVNPDDQVTVGALARATVKGRISDGLGNVLSDFNGTITIELYDALESVETLAHHGDEGRVDIFDTMGSKLYAGAARVENSEFTATITLPANIADNFRPATMSMYAAADNSTREAIGVNRNFYVAGYTEPEKEDTIAPLIESMVLNHSEFKPGDTTDANPLLIAAVSDDVGINLSSAGVGFQITLTLDGMTTYSDIASYYTPMADGNPGGVINYRLENLAPGKHSVRLRVFDTSGNMAEREIEFNVSDDIAPRIFEVFTDANPASTAANFYVRHDRTDNLVEVGIEVFDLMGHLIWSAGQKGMSDSDLSTPVTWDLCDSTGRRVGRGIYLYRATISTDSSKFTTASRRIAVTN